MIAFVVVLLGALGGPARAESPTFMGSDPERRETVHSVEEVSVTFDEPVDPESSELQVSACDKDVTEGEPFVTPEDPNTITVEVDGENPGTYLVEYSVEGVIDEPDEPPAQGSFEFYLHYARCKEDRNGHNGHNGHNKGGNKKGGKGHHHGKRKRDHGSGHEGHAGSDDGADHDDHTATAGGDHDAHSSGGDHRGGSHGEHARRGGDHDRKKHGDGHKRKNHRDHQGHDRPGDPGDDRRPQAGPGRPARPNPVLNLVLALLFPAAIGLVGGRVLRARTPATAS